MTKRIDHLVIVDRQLAGLAEFYRSLGFQVGGRNRHDWGTENHIVQFDGTFLELLTTGDGFQRPAADQATAPFALPIDDFIKRYGSGLAMLVLSSDDAETDLAKYQAAQIASSDGVFYFARDGQGADGQPTRVAFSLSFAKHDAVSHAGFFVCQQHYPENFWFADRQHHENAVTGVSQVTLKADDVDGARRFLQDFSGGAGVAREGWIAPAVETAVGRIQIATAEDCARHYAAYAPDVGDGAFVATHFTSADIEATERVLQANDVTYAVADGRMIVSAADAHGQVLVFEAAA